MELTTLQMETMERLFEAGFRPIAIPPYENAICVHRGEFVAMLGPVASVSGADWDDCGFAGRVAVRRMDGRPANRSNVLPRYTPRLPP